MMSHVFLSRTPTPLVTPTFPRDTGRFPNAPDYTGLRQEQD